MKHYSTYLRFSISLILLTICTLFNHLHAQTIRSYVIFGGNGTCPNGTGQTPPPMPGCAVQISSSTKIEGGSVGSYTLVKSTGNSTINSNIFSGGIIQLANSNIVKGRISAANLGGLPGTILSVGSSTNISGDVDVNGNIVIGGGTVGGKVRHTLGSTYYLGNTLIPNTEGPPNLEPMPTLPAITVFPSATDSNITKTQSINPGSYGNVNLTGNHRVTFNGPGIYVFNTIFNTGNSNQFIFDFKNDPSGLIKIYVHGNADLGKISTSVKGGGGASRISFEGHGTGSVAVNISNGSSGQGSKWLGTIWAPYGAINVGSGTGSSILTGAMLSGTQVNVQSGVSMIFEPLVACTPVTADAGPDQKGINTCGLTTVTLAAKTPGSGTGSWSVINGSGGTFADPLNPASTFSGTAGSTYTLRWSIENGTCGNSSDDVIITFNQNPTNVSAGNDKALEFTGLTKLTGSTGTTGATYSWQASAGGVISSPTNTTEITVSSQGTYTFKVTTTAGCSVSDDAKVTSRLKNLIGSELQSIYDNKTTDNTFFDIKDGYVKIDIIAIAGKRNDALNRLLEAVTFKPGLKDTLPNGLSALTITGRYLVDSLPNLNNLADIINYVRPYYRAILFNEENVGDTSSVGLVRSAGDTTMRTHLVRSGYSMYGDGIKIGVISDSYSSTLSGSTATLPLQPVKTAPFIISPSTLDTIGTLNPIPQTFNTNTAAADVINRDLPPNVHLLPVPNLFPVTGTDEGRAMMQIVHDVAPGAELYFRSGFNTAGDFAAGILQLKDAGCTIIVDDITYPTEPILRDGIVAKTVNTAKAAGVTYFSSAGNFGSRSYEKNFNPVNFNGKVVHNFGGGDVFQKIKLAPGDYTFVFQWVDDIYSLNETTGTQNDLDIYLTKSEDGSGLIGFNRDNLVGDPIEFIPITVSGTDSVVYNVFIVNNTPNVTPNLRMKYIAFVGTPRFMEFNEGTSTVIGHANAEGAIAVGAARFNHVPGHPLLTQKLQAITKPQIETFSSTGGTWVNGVPRQKPDLVGPDGGNTTVKLGQDYPDWALDGFSNFFGTSAAAPHVAAAAALVIQGRQKFLGLSTSPDQIKSLLQATATDMETTGFDYISGSGLVNADSAMRTFAAPRPFSIKLVVPTTDPVTIPGETQFLLTVTGQNFSENSEIWYGDQKLVTVYISPTRDTIQAYIPTFTDNPEIRVYTAPKTTVPDPLDGGFSNSLFFFDADIVIQAVDASMKYGQQVPVFDTIITINGKLLQDTSLTLADIGLTKLKLTTSAPPVANVGVYSIIPSFDPTDLPSPELLVKYNYKFFDAQLSVAKMPITVIPNNQSIFYGDAITNVTFKYQFDPAFPPANLAQLTDTLKLYHKVILPGNALAVVKDFKKVQANGSILSASNLQNLNLMASFNAIKNSRKFTIVNGKFVEATDLNTLNLQHIVDLSSEALYNYIQNPALGNFYSANTNVTEKGLLGAAALGNKTAQMQFINAGGGPGLAAMLNGTLAETIITSDGSKAPIVNDSRVQVLNSVLVTLNASNQWVPVPNSSPVDMVNNKLATLNNGVPQYLGEGQTVQLYNGTLVQVNAAGGGTGLAQLLNAGGGTGLQQILNTSTLTLANAGGGTGLASILNSAGEPLPDGSLVIFPNGAGMYQYVNAVGGGGTGLASILNAGGGTGLASILNAGGGTGLASILNAGGGGTGLASILNADIIGAGPTANSNTAVIIDRTNVNDPLTGNWLGAMLGINMITGLDVGKQYLAPGILVNPNFDIKYGLGEVDILELGCLVTHNPVTNFGSTSNPGKATSLWFSLTTKVSGQLVNNGDYLLFTGGSISFDKINSTPAIKDFSLPSGKIVAVSGILAPITSYDSIARLWTTKVPLGFSSTSDIFLTGAIINSSTGFAKKNGANSVASGVFYSNKNFKDQWAYAMAAYQPQFFYNKVAGDGDVVSINGQYRAGTPKNILGSLVNGASGGGGNNYTGSNSSFDNFTACLVQNTVSRSSIPISVTEQTENPSYTTGEVRIAPNPSRDFALLSFVPAISGISTTTLSTMDGKKISEMNNGFCKAGNRYVKRIEVGKLPAGVYLVQLRGVDKITVKKIIVSR